MLLLSNIMKAIRIILNLIAQNIQSLGKEYSCFPPYYPMLQQ